MCSIFIFLLELTCGQIVIPNVCHGGVGCGEDIMHVTISDCIAREKDGEAVVKDGCKKVKWGDISTKMEVQYYADFMGKEISELVENDQKEIFICNDKAKSGSLLSNNWICTAIIIALSIALIAATVYHFNIHNKIFNKLRKPNSSGMADNQFDLSEQERSLNSHQRTDDGNEGTS